MDQNALDRVIPIQMLLIADNLFIVVNKSTFSVRFGLFHT